MSYLETLNKTKDLYPNINIKVDGLVIKTNFIKSNGKHIGFEHTCQNIESLLKEIPFTALMANRLKDSDFKDKIPT